MKKISLNDTPFYNKATLPSVPLVQRTRKANPPPLNVAPAGQCCDGTGWFLYNVPHGHPLFSVLQKCQCGRAGNPDTRISNLQGDLKAYKHCTFEMWDLERQLEPFAYNGINLTVSNQQSTLQIATRRAKAYASVPKGWLYVHGSFGAGKTHLAAAIGHECAITGMSVMYRNVPELLDNIRSAINHHNLDSLIERFVKTDILILDDIGVEELTSEFMNARLFRIFDERMDKPMIITSNLDIDDLHKRVGGRIGSRLLQASKIYLPLSDYRRYKRKD